ncbi:MAG: ribosome biogenesis GTP-binding protein YihA/YsxC [Cephaloticoccus sp.]|nr:ribosome biogenesis GTP-binding protein YihA/YsxC [Cephaloticoccus sp.]MCF7759013.1 ribosome biogenesis GTP-binding protein YihA/YsxC [Cephaloticoccus sp.]
MKINSASFLTSATNLNSCPPTVFAEFAFIGRSNVGKSSLINMLTMKKGLAKVSETPGKTQLINFFSINGNWNLVDLPGYGYARVSKTQRADFNEAVADFLEKRETLRHTFALIDSRLPPQVIDVEFINWLIGAEIPFAIVFTKTDKQSASKTQANIAHFRQKVLAGITPGPATFISSAETKAGRKEILAHIEAQMSARKKQPTASA